MSELHRIKTPIANLLDDAGGALGRQLLFGEGFHISKIRNGWAEGYRHSDGYKGYVALEALADWIEPTNRVSNLGAHVYPAPDIKTVPVMHLPYQADVTIVGEDGPFTELAGGGFVHKQQLENLTDLEPDYVCTAERFMGTPYLWGGNSQYGIDCSGLISAGLKGAGYKCAADSADQEATLGVLLNDENALQRGDLIFWKGHVGFMASSTLLLHANAYHMKVVDEPLAQAETRILATGGGAVTSRKRLMIEY
ncbi:MAG: NlpC/P60 family protein [Amylibacter sp.]